MYLFFSPVQRKIIENILRGEVVEAINIFAAFAEILLGKPGSIQVSCTQVKHEKLPLVSGKFSCHPRRDNGLRLDEPEKGKN